MPGAPSSMPRSTAADPSMPRGSARGTGANTPAAEFAKPLWQLGASSFAFVDAATIICTYCVRGSWRLARLDVSTGALTDLDTPYTDIGALHAAAGRALFIAGSPSQRAALISLDLTTIPTPAPSHAEAKPAPEPDASMPGDSTPTTAAKTPMPDTAEQTSPATRPMPGGSAHGAASTSAALSLTTLKSTSDTTIDPRYLSTPETLEYPTTLDGAPTTAFAFYYPPHNADYDNAASAHPEALEGRAVPNPSTQLSPSPRRESAPGGEVPTSAELPPLLVISHGGPTAATSAVLSPRIQYWTSRGIAVLDVNYGGSTGFGTEYRRRLNHRWGIVDVDDCVNAARYLVDRGDVDPARLAITGGSAGGYTTLCALTMRDLFSAGASYYGVAELEALARDTHKFESRYLDNLIGPYPAPEPASSGERSDAPSGAVGAQPTRGESEGSPLSPSNTRGVGRAAEPQIPLILGL
ncbi:MAG TPA: prolyl oligopeptidase family serine peptidase [Gemmatimonadales bacterium]|nr:prolyl oligopeptidase family serine peptidase [Gemmatimonadales bacterium]